jgi:hypothetical protein
MSVVAAMLLVCHGRCCCSGPWPLLLFSTSYIQCSTAAALLPAARTPSPVEVLAPAAAAARIGATAGSGELASATAITRGRGELRPGRCRHRERGLRELAPSLRRERERGHHDVLIDRSSARIDLAAPGTVTRRLWVRREVALSSLVPRASTGRARLQKNES